MCYLLSLKLLSFIRKTIQIGPYLWKGSCQQFYQMEDDNRGVTFSAIWLGLLFPLLLLKFHVSIVHHSTCELVNGHLFICRESQDVHSSLLKELSW